MQNIDLQMLRVLEEIFKTGSLSRTADRFGMSQPAISLILNKLRDHYGDRLFVRVGHEMRPTSQAQGLRETVGAAIAAIESAMNYRSTFVPELTERMFGIAVTDIGQIVMVPAFLKMFRARAPLAGISISSIDARTPQLLQTGELDLAVGMAPGMPSGLIQRALFDESFVVLVRRDHPRIRGEITAAEFAAEGAIRVISSSSTHLIIDRALERLGIARNVQVSVPNFMIVAKLIAETDYVTILPRRAGTVLASENGLQALAPPFAIADYKVRQFWHERQTNDGGNRWLRELFVELFRSEQPQVDQSVLYNP